MRAAWRRGPKSCSQSCGRSLPNRSPSSEHRGKAMLSSGWNESEAMATPSAGSRGRGQRDRPGYRRRRASAVSENLPTTSTMSGTSQMPASARPPTCKCRGPGRHRLRSDQQIGAVGLRWPPGRRSRPRRVQGSPASQTKWVVITASSWMAGELATPGRRRRRNEDGPHRLDSSRCRRGALGHSGEDGPSLADPPSSSRRIGGRQTASAPPRGGPGEWNASESCGEPADVGAPSWVERMATP